MGERKLWCFLSDYDGGMGKFAQDSQLERARRELGVKILAKNCEALYSARPYAPAPIGGASHAVRGRVRGQKRIVYHLLALENTSFAHCMIEKLL